jgi:hypothetical protein
VLYLSIIFVRLPVCNKYSDVIVTFISIHSIIIYVVCDTQCHLGLFSVLTQESSFHVSQIEHEAPNQCKNKRSTKFISKGSCLKHIRFSKREKNVETLDQP